MYKVIRYFEDIQDAMHPYNTGDIFPREGMSVSADRLAALSTDRNLQRTPLIECVPEPIVENAMEPKPEPVKKARRRKKDAD